MSLKKPKTFSSVKEVFKSFFPKTTNEKSGVFDEACKHTDYDFPKRLADNFRSALEDKRNQQPSN